jgi:hypothetical protein
LLQKDRHKRLGSGYRGFDEVKRHDFFKLIVWEDLLAKRIPPPFNPNVVSVFTILCHYLEQKHILNSTSSSVRPKWFSVITYLNGVISDATMKQ